MTLGYVGDTGTVLDQTTNVNAFQSVRSGLHTSQPNGFQTTAIFDTFLQVTTSH